VKAAGEAVLSLPSRRWKKVRLSREVAGRYTVTVLSRVEDEEEFERLVHEELGACVDEGDRIEEKRWPQRSVTIAISDVARFCRRLALMSVLVERDNG
jgi:hypothetical protein